jgi:hypothetical protein
MDKISFLLSGKRKMERSLLQKDKKGVSLMVSYVLLVIIAIGLSVAVFAYLQLYLPREEAKCLEDISLSIDEASCEFSHGENYNISIKLTNRGLFNVNGAFIRIGEQGRVFKVALNQEDNFLFLEAGLDNVLNPSESWEPDSPYTYVPDNPSTPQELEVEPFLYEENKPVLCEKSVVSKTIFCISEP